MIAKLDDPAAWHWPQPDRCAGAMRSMIAKLDDPAAWHWPRAPSGQHLLDRPVEISLQKQRLRAGQTKAEDGLGRVGGADRQIAWISAGRGRAMGGGVTIPDKRTYGGMVHACPPQWPKDGTIWGSPESAVEIFWIGVPPTTRSMAM
jgi:hypothetical protein